MKYCKPKTIKYLFVQKVAINVGLYYTYAYCFQKTYKLQFFLIHQLKLFHRT